MPSSQAKGLLETQAWAGPADHGNSLRLWLVSAFAGDQHNGLFFILEKEKLRLRGKDASLRPCCLEGPELSDS